MRDSSRQPLHRGLGLSRPSKTHGPLCSRGVSREPCLWSAGATGTLCIRLCANPVRSHLDQHREGTCPGFIPAQSQTLGLISGQSANGSPKGHSNKKLPTVSQKKSQS